MNSNVHEHLSFSQSTTIDTEENCENKLNHGTLKVNIFAFIRQ